MKKILLFIFLPLNIFSAVFAPVWVMADDTSVVVNPSMIEVTAGVGHKISKKVSIINRSNFPLRLKVEAKNYRQVSEEGKLEFYDEVSNPASSWIIPQYLEISVRPLETKEVGVVISVPEGIKGGGHYGALLFKPVAGSHSLGVENFGALVLLTVSGGGMEVAATAEASGFSTGFFQQGNPVDFEFEIYNSGNTHFLSAGRLAIKNWMGEEVGSYNTGQLLIYPKTTRDFRWRWSETPQFGIYKAEIWLSEKLVDGRWFILFPWRAAGAVLLAIASVLGAIFLRKKLFTKGFGLKVKKFSSNINIQ